MTECNRMPEAMTLVAIDSPRVTTKSWSSHRHLLDVGAFVSPTPCRSISG